MSELTYAEYRAHASYDSFLARTDRLKAAREALDLLSDAADALERGKPHITAERLERVMDKLTADIEKLSHKS